MLLDLLEFFGWLLWGLAGLANYYKNRIGFLILGFLASQSLDFLSFRTGQETEKPRNPKLKISYRVGFSRAPPRFYGNFPTDLSHFFRFPKILNFETPQSSVIINLNKKNQNRPSNKPPQKSMITNAKVNSILHIVITFSRLTYTSKAKQII